MEKKIEEMLKPLEDIMKVEEFEQVNDGEWVQPTRKGYQMKCCDCGLIHILDFRLIKYGDSKHKIQFRAKRKEMKILRKITNPTEDELKADAYKSFKIDGGTFYVTEYGCWEVVDGKVMKLLN